MKRISFASVVLVLTAVVLLTTASQAQTPPEFLEHYRVLPRLSTLHESGGIAGVDWRYRLLGSYDFQHGIGWTGTASFRNAEIWGSPLGSASRPRMWIDVDQILNLEGLKGEALPVAAPFDVYRFTREHVGRLVGAVVRVRDRSVDVRPRRNDAATRRCRLLRVRRADGRPLTAVCRLQRRWRRRCGGLHHAAQLRRHERPLAPRPATTFQPAPATPSGKSSSARRFPISRRSTRP